MNRLTRLILFAGALCSPGFLLALQSPIRTDLRFHSMGGAYTALLDHNLMAWHNPAAFAFMGRSDARDLQAMDEGEVGRSRRRNPAVIGLPSFQMGLSTSAWSNVGRIQSFIGLFMPASGSLLPAPFDTIAGNLGLTGLTASTNAPIDITGIFTNAASRAAFSNVITGIHGLKLDTSFDVEAFSFTTRGWGLGLNWFSDLHVGLPTASSFFLGIPLPTITLQSDLVFHAAAGFRFDSEIPMSMGFTAKVFNRVLMEADTDAKLLALLSDPTAITTAISGISNVSSLLTGQVSLGVASNYTRVGNGVAADIGYLIQPVDHLWLGATLRDAAGLMIWFGGSNEWIPPSLDLGVSWSPRISAIGFFERPIFSVSFSDAWGIHNEPVFKRIHAGLEFGTFFDSLRLRVGLYQGFPTGSFSALINTRFLSQLPVVKLFFPRDPVTLLLLPKRLDYTGLQEFARRNLVVWLTSTVARFVSLFDIYLEGGFWGKTSALFLDSTTVGDYQASFGLRLELKL